MVIASLEDWSTLKPCNSIISGKVFVGLSAVCLEELPKQIKCKFGNLLHIANFCDNAIYNGTITRKLHCEYRKKSPTSNDVCP